MQAWQAPAAHRLLCTYAATHSRFSAKGCGLRMSSQGTSCWWVVKTGCGKEDVLVAAG
jgi:hypothetical protein